MDKLKRDLSELDVWSLALGAIIGWGCFVLPGNKFLNDAGPLGTAIALSIGALIMIFIARSYGVLIHRFPVAGGEFTYAYVGFKRKHAFFAAWMLGLSYLSIVPLNATALGLISRYMFPGVIQVGYLYTIAGWDVYLGEILVSSLTLILLTIANIRGVKLFGALAKFLAFGLSGGIVILFVLTLLSPQVDFNNLQPLFSPNKSVWAGILSIVAIAPWAFVGFDTIPQASEEFKFNPKKSYRLMLISIIIGALMYILVNTMTAMVFPWVEYLQTQPHWATGEAVEMVAGKAGLFILGIAILSAILSGINGFLLATSRLFLGMARTYALPEVFGTIHPVHKTPSFALLFVLAISLIAPWVGRAALLWIVDMASIGAAIGYFYTSATAFVLYLRDKNNAELKKNAPYAFLGSLFSIGFAVLLLMPGSPAVLSTPSLIALVIWVLMGLGFYLSSKNYRNATDTELAQNFGLEDIHGDA